MTGVSRGETEALTTGKGSSRLKKALVITTIVLVVLGAGVYFGVPPLGAALVKSRLARTLDDGTTIELESVSLSWGGPQRFEGLRVHSPDGHETDLAGTVSQNLRALIWSLGKCDLGEARITGHATLNADALRPSDESDTTITDLPTGWGTDKPGSIELGKRFGVELEIDRVEVTVRSAFAPDTVGVLSGRARARSGEPTEIDGVVELTPEGRSTGTVRVEGSITGLIPPNGRVTRSGFETQSTITIRGVSTALAGMLPGVPTDVDTERSFGATLDGEISIDGRVGQGADAVTRVSLRTPAGQLESHSRLRNGAFTPEGDNTLTLETAGLSEGWPAMGAWLGSKGVELTRAPEVSLAFEDFAWMNDPDWRGSRATGRVSVGPSALTLTTPESETRIGIEPSTLTLGVVGDSFSLAGSVRSTVDDSPAGVVDLDLEGTGFLARDGSIAFTRVPGVSGSVTLTDVPSSLLQTMVPASSGVDLTRELGASVTATVAASAPAGQPTHLALDLRSDNATARGSFTIDGAKLRVDPSVGVTVSLERITPTVTALLGEDAPVRLGEDQGARLSIGTLSMELDAPGGAATSIRGGGEFSISPVVMTVLGREQTVRPATITGEFDFGHDDLTITGRVGEIAIGPNDQALQAVEFELVTTERASEPSTRSTIRANTVRTAAIGEWLGEDSPVGNALVRLRDGMSLETEPSFEGGVVRAPFAFDGKELGLTGELVSEGSTLTGEVILDVTETDIIDTVLELREGVSKSVLGQIATVRVGLGLPEGSGNPGATLASITVVAERAQTVSPVKLLLGGGAVALVEPGEVRARVTPESFAILSGRDPDDPAEIHLAGPTSVTLRVNELEPGDAEGTWVRINAALSTGEFSMTRDGVTTRTYTSMGGSVRSIEGSMGAVAVRGSLDEGDRQTVQLAVIATGVFSGDGGFEPMGGGYTGTLTLDEAQPALLDVLTGSDLLSELLGPTVSGGFTLDNFPQDRGTLDGTVTGPRASGEIHAWADGGIVTLAQPAVFTLTEITRPFSDSFAPMLPVIGSLTKLPDTHEACTVTIDSLHLPLPFDRGGFGFHATIDPGTATIAIENTLGEMLTGTPSIGDSVEPFVAGMDGGVLTIETLTIPIGEFSVPARGTYDLVNNTEDVFIQIPASSLVGEAIRGPEDVIEQLLNRFIRVGLRKQGTLGGDNPWEIDVDTSDEREGDPDPLGDSIKDLLDRIGG